MKETLFPNLEHCCVRQRTYFVQRDAPSDTMFAIKTHILTILWGLSDSVVALELHIQPCSEVSFGHIPADRSRR